MKRLDLPLVAVCFVYCGLGIAPAAAETENHITHGPILGRLSPNGIRIWARTAQTGSFGVRYGSSPEELRSTSPLVSTRLEHDNTGWVELSDLKANTKYSYELFLPQSQRPTGRRGSFKTLPDSADYVDPELNPKGLFNFSFEFACGNNQTSFPGPALPTFKTMLERLKDKIHFAILNGDWLYETQREYRMQQWTAQVDASPEEVPEVLKVAPTLVGVWQNYKHFLDQGENLARWHRYIPSFFTYDDHEILNDVWGAGTPGLRDRRAVYRDVGVRAWYDYLGWSNPVSFQQQIFFGKAKLESGSDVLTDSSADFSRLDLNQASNLHVHWGTATAGVNDNALDGVGGDPNAGVYRIVQVLDRHRLRVSPAARVDGSVSYSIGRRSYYQMRVSNCDFFVLDNRGQREMHDVRQPDKPGLSMLGKEQREWLMEGMKKSDAEFIFVVSTVNFMVPHVGGGKVRTVNKDDAWTVFLDEREKLIRFWDSLDRPVLVLTGDLHNSFVIKITDNVWEFASGPHNSSNHWASDEGDRPASGRFKYGPRPVEIRWSTYFRNDIPRENLQYPTYCVVQVNNAFNNPKRLGQERWVAFPKPQVVFQYYDGKTGDLRYAEAVVAR